MKFRRIVVLATVLVLAGACSAPRELAVVTERVPVKPLERPAPESAPDSASAVVGPQTQPASTIVPPGSGDPAQPSRFDGGKMWTFEDPPLDYFESAYGFRPSANWLARARNSALRFSGYCSASFVSPNGLVMTNHHCARQSVTDVTREGEDLLDTGFFSRSLELERKVEDLYVDQLLSIKDVTDEIRVRESGGATDEKLAEMRNAKATSLARRMTEEASSDSSIIVEVVPLYNGGKYSAYSFRRYRDVRLVMAPELHIGFFGGDSDNFTYPRYNLDMAFFRVYDEEGTPLKSEDYFAWSAAGAEEGDVVFVVGNPGSTSRLTTVAQLEFERDVSLPHELRVAETRAQILGDYITANPVKAEEFDLRNVWFSLQNAIKANHGQLEGLNDDALMERKRRAEMNLKDSVASSRSLTREFGSLFDDIAKMQRAKKAVARQSGAFTQFSSEVMSSHLLLRALYAYVHDLLKQRGAPEDRLEEMRSGGAEVKDWPVEIEQHFIAARLAEMRDYLGPSHPTIRSLLGDSTPDSVAARVARTSALVDSTGFVTLLEKGYLASDDSSVPVINSIGSLYFSLGQQLSAFESREENLNVELGRLQFQVFGTAVPPDASFSLRLADGIVAGYEYNGTTAPAYTTFNGLYDRHAAFGINSEWALPERWARVPEQLDLDTPLNVVSTNDITGGNSGSPLLNSNLEVVGLVFDSNIEALPNEYLFREGVGRTVSVDSRGIIESLGAVYDMDRIVLELTRGRLVATEEEADERQDM